MRFSIVIPLYNKASYIKKALDSICQQTFRDFELIVVDDGSSDGSFGIAREVLGKSNLDYQLIRQKNAGVSVARNNGVAASYGDFICFLDADDWWDSSFLHHLDRLIGQYPDAGLYGTNYYYVKNGRKRVCIKRTKTGYINYCKVYAEENCMPLTSISVAIPRQVFISHHGFKPHLKLGEDFDLWIRIALDSKVAFLDIPLAYYNQDVDPTSRGIGHLVPPSVHMLWNLDYLCAEEKRNPNYKKLIDNLRVYSLLPYFISKQYHDAAKQELAKVDWSNQPKNKRFLYKMPVFILQCRRLLLKSGSIVKQTIRKSL